jgi:bis(5'-nucleosyl)-tetraphosphatase (symmetrical)
MSTYVIGDVQGCYAELQALLTHIQFNSTQDYLWFTGDLVNRGPHSLEVLRFVKSLGDHQQIVLGNHDLHLLALAHGAHAGWHDDTLKNILTAPDREELITWLSQQPLLYHDKKWNTVLVHAGLAPTWDLATAKQLAKEVENAIQNSLTAPEFFQHMYGNEPNHWGANLTKWDRLRCITNYLTRARFCHPDGRLVLEKTDGLESAGNLIPWFQIPHRASANLKILFGHWAALGGVTNTPNTYALDTGCVWGYRLTAMRLEDEQRFSVACKQQLPNKNF